MRSHECCDPAGGVGSLCNVPCHGAQAPALTINGQPETFDYSKRFAYKWTGNALHTMQQPHVDTAPVNVTVGATVLAALKL